MTIKSNIEGKDKALRVNFGRTTELPTDNAEAAIKMVQDNLEAAVAALELLIATAQYAGDTGNELAKVAQAQATKALARIARVDGQIALKAQVFN